MNDYTALRSYELYNTPHSSHPVLLTTGIWRSDFDGFRTGGHKYVKIMNEYKNNLKHFILPLSGVISFQNYPSRPISSSLEWQ